MATIAEQSGEEVRTAGDSELLDQGLRHLQTGQWQAAIACLSELAERHPENRRYQRLLDEARVKARVKDRPPRGRRRCGVAHSRRVWGLIVLNLMVWTILAGRELFWQHVVPTLAQSHAVAAERSLIEQGQEALIRGDLVSAHAAFQEVLSQNPENPIARQALAELEKQQWLAETYAQAQELAAEERWEAALGLLQEIHETSPGYRDVEAEIKRIRRVQRYAALFDQAESLFHAGLWVQAAQQFEKLHRMAPDFKADVVESRLFACSMNQAQAFLENVPRDPVREVSNLQSAVKWLARASDVRPRERSVEIQYRLARDYLRGLLAYRQANWEMAIVHLSSLYTAAPDYRRGRGAYLLQGAYVQAGRRHLQTGRQDRALKRFRQAIAIGLQGHARPVPPEGQRLLHRADELAQQGLVEEAVDLYRRILAGMGFGGVSPARADSTAGLYPAWQRQISCSGRFSDEVCADMLVWQRMPLPLLRLPASPSETESAEPSEPVESPAPTETIYVVRPGDTLSEIALRFGTTIRAMMEANPIIKNPRLIRPGWRLVIPTG